MKRKLVYATAVLVCLSGHAFAQNSAQLTPDAACTGCQRAPLFSKLQAMFAAHRTQAGYAACQKSCCQKGCVQKGCLQKPRAPKCCAPKVSQKPCVSQKPRVKRPCIQKPVLQKPKCCAPKCVQKGCLQKSCVQKGCVQKGCAQKGCLQKSCVQKPKCAAPKGCCQKGGCGRPRGLLLSIGLFNRGGGKCGKGSQPASYDDSAAPHQGETDELPTPTIDASDPFGDDPRPLRATSYTRNPAHGPVR